MGIDTKELGPSLLAVLALVACTTDQGSGVPPQTRASDLTYAQANALCQEMDVSESVKVVGCYSEAVTLTDEVEVCEQIAFDCQSRPSEPEVRRCLLAPIALEGVSCAEQITAGQIEDCLNDLVAGFEQLAEGINCQQVPDIPVPVSCEAIHIVCPEVLGLD